MNLQSFKVPERLCGLCFWFSCSDWRMRRGVESWFFQMEVQEVQSKARWSAQFCGYVGVYRPRIWLFPEISNPMLPHVYCRILSWLFDTGELDRWIVQATGKIQGETGETWSLDAGRPSGWSSQVARCWSLSLRHSFPRAWMTLPLRNIQDRWSCDKIFHNFFPFMNHESILIWNLSNSKPCSSNINQLSILTNTRESEECPDFFLPPGLLACRARGNRSWCWDARNVRLMPWRRLVNAGEDVVNAGGFRQEKRWYKQEHGWSRGDLMDLMDRELDFIHQNEIYLAKNGILWE